MGEVYRAKDPRLGREVAIKVLPESVTEDPQALSRFDREARAVAALSHPNILAIHDIGSHGGVAFIVTELLDGETLRSRLRGPVLSWRKAVEIGVAIAEGLGAAHAKHIIHRDLKPENLFLTTDGRVKILDFGLARVRPQRSLAETSMPTETEAGTVMGTVGYMSPEQVRGAVADEASDIFSLGCVLYEMVTARRAFLRDTAAQTMTAILEEDPAPLPSLPGHLGFELERIIRACLEKDPARRFHSSHDVAFALRGILERSASDGPGAATREVSGPAPSPGSLRKAVMSNPWLSGISLTAVALAGGTYLLRLNNPTPVSPTTSAAPAVPLTAYPGFEVAPSLSPDGSQVAFSWNGPAQDNYDIYVKLVGPGEPLQLTKNPARDDMPAWSPDGRTIAFYRITSETTADLIVMPALGGAELRLATVRPVYSRNRPFSNLAWTPDGRWLMFGGEISRDSSRGIWLISADGGETRPLTALQAGEAASDVSPIPSPNGDRVAFIREFSIDRSAVLVAPLTPGFAPLGRPVQVTSDRSGILGIAWTPDGTGLVFSSSGHGAVSRLNRLALKPDGSHSSEPELMPFGDQAAAISISKTGRLVYSAQFRDTELYEVPISGATPPKAQATLSSTFDEHTPHYSPDGKQLAFASTRTGSEEIWISNSDGTNPVKMTAVGGPQCSNPQWSPTERMIVFNSRRGGSADLYTLQPDSGKVSPLTDGPSNDVEPSWSHDGRWIYFASNTTGRSEVWRMPATGGAHTRVTQQGGATAIESSDRQFLYYAKDFVSPTSIWRVPVGGGEETHIVDGLSYSMNFVATDRGLYFVAVGDSPERTSLDFFDFATSKRTTVTTLNKPWWYGIALSPDGKSLLLPMIASAGSNLMLLENFR
jgi:eukaryotic-like serine/threonine-protein kinase